MTAWSELLGVQHEIASRSNQQYVGQVVEVLVEGYSKAARTAQRRDASRQTAPPHTERSHWKTPDQLTGRTRGDQIVVFQGPARLIGQLVPVRITAATALTLHGDPGLAASALRRAN